MVFIVEAAILTEILKEEAVGMKKASSEETVVS